MALGIRIRHRFDRSTVCLVPIPSKPLQVGPADICPGCRLSRGVEVVHPVKTIHLWLDDTGSCLVSEGVLEELRMSGMPNLEVVGSTPNPPDLQIGVPRELQDYNGRAFIIGRR